MEVYVVYEISTGNLIGLLDSSVENIREDHLLRIRSEDNISTNTIIINESDVVMPWMITIDGNTAIYDPAALPEHEPEIEMATVSD